jgi:predicted metal-dependent hydrolase
MYAVYTPMAVEIEGAGRVVVERSPRAKRMRITVKAGSVRVSIPRGVSLGQAEAFVREHREWIRVHLARMARCEEVGRALLASLPPIAEPRAAREKIALRIRELALENGFSYAGLTVRNQKTRWGSCSACNAISLNIQLARLPGALMDYVILHELVHTRIKGHGRDFWQELDRYAGDARALRRELRKYMLSLM